MDDQLAVRPIEILLVEDNPGDVRLTVEALHDGKLANRMSIARDGAEAWSRLRPDGTNRGQLPDVILLDLNLPQISGRELLALLKGHRELARIPVVVLTTSRAEHDVLRSLQLGATAYMTKPVDTDQLLRLVSEIDVFHVSIVTTLTA